MGSRPRTGLRGRAYLGHTTAKLGMARAFKDKPAIKIAIGRYCIVCAPKHSVKLNKSMATLRSQKTTEWARHQYKWQSKVRMLFFHLRWSLFTHLRLRTGGNSLPYSTFSRTFRALYCYFAILDEPAKEVWTSCLDLSEEGH